MDRSRLIKAAKGEEPFDLVIKNAKLVNVLTREIYNADLGICEGYIAHITQPGEQGLAGVSEYDADGKYAIPGLIDTHIHIESSMMNPANLARAILPHGTTTIINDPHEIANVAGLEGVKYILEASADLPLKVFVLAPSCLPSAQGVETTGYEFNAPEIEAMMKWDRVVGLAEVMDFPGVIHQSSRMTEILDTARKFGRFMQGHAPFLTGRDLSAYLCSGVSSDHETVFADEARYKLRAGMTLECRESSIAQNIKELAAALRDCNYPPNTTLCTDDREPDDLLRDGHIDHVLRRAVAEGIPVMEAVRMATCNAAQLVGLHEYGVLAPGRVADVVLLDDLESFVVNEVFANGNLVAQEGELLVEITTPDHPLERKNTINLKSNPAKENFEIKAGGQRVKVNVIAYDEINPLITKLDSVELPVKDGCVDISGDKSLACLAIFERHGRNGNTAVGLVRGSGLKKGAIASTVSHDCHNLTVIGLNQDDMVVAASKLVEVGGGIVCVVDGQVTALVELPIGGLMSPQKVETLAPLTAHLKKTIKELGLAGDYPLLRVATFALAVIPEVKLTDMGLVDVLTQTFVPTIAE